MAQPLFTNNAATTLASGITNVATTLTVASGQGVLFPSPTGGNYSYITLINAAGTVLEIVKLTARSTDTLTITRGQEGTTASAFSTGDKVELRVTAAGMSDTFANGGVQSATAVAGTGISIGSVTTTGAATHTITNTGVTSVAAGTGISVSASTGGVTITNTSASLPGVLGQAFTSNGTFTIPTGVTALKITVVGGGGGGGSAYSYPCFCTAVYGYAAGGSSGGAAISYLTGLTPGGTLAVVIGGGGGSNGSGGSSTVASGTQTITTITGGGGTSPGQNNTTPTTGGTATNGTLNFNGSSGTFAIGSYSGSGGASIFGGQTASVQANNNGISAVTRGAGGSGGANMRDNGTVNAGGSGAAGVVIFEW